MPRIINNEVDEDKKSQKLGYYLVIGIIFIVGIILLSQTIWT